MLRERCEPGGLRGGGGWGGVDTSVPARECSGPPLHRRSLGSARLFITGRDWVRGFGSVSDVFISVWLLSGGGVGGGVRDGAGSSGLALHRSQLKQRWRGVEPMNWSTLCLKS